MWHIKQFFSKLARIARWIPILWNDVDYDYSSIYRIMQFKLKQIRLKLKADDITVGTDKYCKQIRLAELLLERMIQDDYLSEEYSAHFQKYPIVWETDEETGYRKSVRQHDPDQDREFKRLSDHEAYLVKQDEEYLAKHLKKHMKKWWN